MSGTNGAIAPSPGATISLSEIPYSLQVPGSYFEVRANYSQAGLLGYPARALIIGQMLAGGSGQANTPYPIYAAADGAAYFGAGSIAAQMVAAFIAANPWVELQAIGVADAALAVKAAGTFAITGTATASGTLALYVNGIRIAVPVAIGDTAAVVATNAVAAADDLLTAAGALPLSPGALPFTIAASVGTVTVTALHGGTLGNQIPLMMNFQRGDVTPAGLAVTVSAMAAGATDPDVSLALAAVAETWFTDVVMCWADASNVGELEAQLTTRYAAMGKLDAHAYGAITGTAGAVQSTQSALNSKFRTVIGADNAPQAPWLWAASLAGVASYYLAEDPSRQLRSLALPGIMAPAQADRYTETERNILLGAGITTFDVAVDGTVLLERVVTESTADANGVPDMAWHDIMVPKTLSRIRYDWIGYISIAYPRNKLADDGTLAAEFDDTVVTPKRLKGAWAGRCRVYAEAGWIEHSAETVKQSSFVRDGSDPNRVNSRQQVRIIGNLMILAGRIEFQAAA